MVPAIDFPLLRRHHAETALLRDLRGLDIRSRKPGTSTAATAPMSCPLTVPLPAIAKPSIRHSSKAPSPPSKAGERSMRSEAPKACAGLAQHPTSDYNNLLVLQDFIPAATTPSRTLTTFSGRLRRMRVVAGGVAASGSRPHRAWKPAVHHGRSARRPSSLAPSASCRMWAIAACQLRHQVRQP